MTLDFRMLKADHKVIIYAQDRFSTNYAKTAIGFIKYAIPKTLCVVDRKLIGKYVSDIFPGFPEIPIVESIETAKRKFPSSDVLLIGIAPAGGRLPPEWIGELNKALDLKLNIVNGLHDFLWDIDLLRHKAESNSLFIWDVRNTKKKFNIANARVMDYSGEIVLTVGTDAAIGKMTVALELTKSAKKRNLKAKFIATGQTGMMISGEGVPIDAITGDFMAGAVEEEVIRALNEHNQIVFVEGQGSILHPGWSGVTLGLLHGSLPHKMILCHKALRKSLKDTKVKIESLRQFIEVYEYVSLPLRKAKVVGIALNTVDLTSNEALNEIRKTEEETGLVTDDVIRFSGDKLLEACLK